MLWCISLCKPIPCSLITSPPFFLTFSIRSKGLLLFPPSILLRHDSCERHGGYHPRYIGLESHSLPVYVICAWLNLILTPEKPWNTMRQYPSVVDACLSENTSRTMHVELSLCIPFTSLYIIGLFHHAYLYLPPNISTQYCFKSDITRLPYAPGITFTQGIRLFPQCLRKDWGIRNFSYTWKWIKHFFLVWDSDG